MLKFLLVCACALVLCPACTKSRGTADDTAAVPEEKKIILGFSQIGAESAWRAYNTRSIQLAAAQENVQLLFSNAEQKQENQIKALRSFIVYQVDVIAFVPIVQDGWDNVLREAQGAGIPVIVCDRKIHTSDPNLYAAYIGSDNEEEGRRAARFLLRKYEGQPGPLNILEVRGTDGSSASDGRIRGFHELMDADARFSVIHSESGDFLPARGKEIAQDILQAAGGTFRIGGNPVDIIFSTNDGMTLGMLSVLREHGIRTGTGTGVTVVSVDAQQEAVNSLKAGEINCLVECNPEQGAQIIGMAKTLAAGGQVPRLTHVEETVFSEFDDLDAIEPRGY